MSIPGAGHDLHLEQAQTLRAALSDFLRKPAWETPLCASNGP
jgi:pimeloyl-ACP methyl ester carboxylesterase